MSVQSLASLLFRRRAVVLTGAGCSTESGIPDYRGPISRLKPRKPMQYQEFIKRPEARQRYWARSAIGWPRFRAALPNQGHRALARLQEAGVVQGIVTQNVDRLHNKAGSADVIELHGALSETRCLSCGARDSRDALQERILQLNPAFPFASGDIAPDGDVDLESAALSSFAVPPCRACNGVLKPDVVFFGESVPRDRVERAFDQVDAADVLLVVGSSLTVYSGYRFATRAYERGIPVAIINVGETRADELAMIKIEAPAGQVLTELSELLA